MEQFTEISLILFVALLISIVMRFLKQPLVIGYIITGLLVGPYFLNILTSVEVVELFSKLGITALLFIVGLGLSPKVLKELGVVSTVTGVGQVLFTSIFGYILGILLGFSTLESIYIAVALTFSSTIIILKLLSDKGDVNKLYGRISIGFLLVQDLIATIILVGISSLSSFHGGISTDAVLSLLFLLMQGLFLLMFLFMFSTHVLSRMTVFFAKSQEFLFISSLAWGMMIASLYHILGLSIEIGALVAGVTLSMTPYSNEISSRMKPLRDFFITLFFILLGYQMVFDNWSSLLAPTVLFSTFILIGNPIIVLILLNLMGYTRKTGFMAGLTVAQISEFSLILIKLGFDSGHLSREILSMITLVGIFTIAGSTYLILYSEKIFSYIGKYLALLEFRKVGKVVKREEEDFEAIIFGYKRAGPEFGRLFKEKGMKFLVVDYNPNCTGKIQNTNGLYEYGDASDVEFLGELPLKSSKFIVSTIPDLETNMLISQAVRKINDQAIIIVISDTMKNALELYSAGVTVVVLSHYIGAHFAADFISTNGSNLKKYEHFREDHVKYLKSIDDFEFESY